MRPPAPESLYAHVPYCASRCSYCDFYSGVGHALAERSLAASLTHLRSMTRRFGVTGFRTVYVGGGTPSALDRNALSAFLSELRRAAGPGLMEFTVEANPQDLDSELLSILEDRGVNRLSVGVQSLEEGARALVGRRGSVKEVRAALDLIAARWKGRWSADLMYGLPGQSACGLRRDATLLAGLGAGHLSLYELTPAEGTALASALDSGALSLPDPDEAHEQFLAARGALEAAGLRRYEVSNWAKPGQESLHNGAYWAMAGWLGIGPSASGTIRTECGFLRLDAVADARAYCLNPLAAVGETQIRGATAGIELVMMGLRTRAGLNLGELRALAGEKAAAEIRACLARFPKLISLMGDRASPTDAGMDTLNRVLVACMEALSGEP